MANSELCNFQQKQLIFPISNLVYFAKRQKSKSWLHYVRQKCWLSWLLERKKSQQWVSWLLVRLHHWPWASDIYRCYLYVRVWMVIENKIVQTMQLINHSIHASIVKRVKRVWDSQMCSQHTPTSVEIKMCNLYITFKKIQIFLAHGMHCDCVHWTWVDSFVRSIVMGYWTPTCFLHVSQMFAILLDTMKLQRGKSNHHSEYSACTQIYLKLLFIFSERMEKIFQKKKMRKTRVFEISFVERCLKYKKKYVQTFFAAANVCTCIVHSYHRQIHCVFIRGTGKRVIL